MMYCRFIEDNDCSDNQFVKYILFSARRGNPAGFFYSKKMWTLSKSGGVWYDSEDG